jgi:pyrroline-5-carboxylate reductase
MKVGFIGTGSMGGALLQAMARGGYDLVASNRGREKLEKVCAETGAKALENNLAVVENADVVFLAVKPVFMADVVREIAPAVGKDKLVVTMAAGLELSFYEELLGADKKILRIMPNTPAQVGAGVTAYCANGNVTEEEKQTVVRLLETAGTTAELPERLMGAVTALTGSSPAYVYLFIEAMADGGVMAGIPRQQAQQLAAQAVLGAAKMVLETGKHPGELKDAVCSPAGTTIQAVAELEKRGLRSAVIEAMRVCAAAGK